MAHAYAAGVVVAVVGCVGVVAYHLARRQVITSLDLLALPFAVVNVVLYFGPGNTWLVSHVAIVSYTVLALQSAVRLFRGDPWTLQFTRRLVRPGFVTDPRFRRMNVWTTVVWTVAFVACDVRTVLVNGTPAIWLPVLVLVLAAVVSRVGTRVPCRGPRVSTVWSHGPFERLRYRRGRRIGGAMALADVCRLAPQIARVSASC